MSEDDPRGRFVWHDLITTEPAAAQSFYTELVGWGTSIFEGAATPYTMWTRGEIPLDGVAELPEEARQATSTPRQSARRSSAVG